jgi:hypothetical protein
VGEFVRSSCRTRYLGRSGVNTPIFGGNPKGAVLSNRLLARTLTAYIVFLNVGCVAHAQHVVDQGIVIENVTLISPERAAPLLNDPRLTMSLPPAVIDYLRSAAGAKARTACQTRWC